MCPNAHSGTLMRKPECAFGYVIACSIAHLGSLGAGCRSDPRLGTYSGPTRDLLGTRPGPARREARGRKISARSKQGAERAVHDEPEYVLIPLHGFLARAVLRRRECG